MKKILSTILILTMLLSASMMLTAFPGFAAEEAAPASTEATAVELPNYDESWTAINSINDLAGIESNKKYYLNTDLTITDSWTPLARNSFTLDGRDPSGKVHKIIFGSENKSVTTSKTLFASTTSATIQNLELVGKIAISTNLDKRYSPLGNNSFVNPVIKNVNSSVDMTYTGPDATANGQEPFAGIICWVADGGSTLIENCVYSGTIRYESYVKGVSGIVAIWSTTTNTGGTGTIRNCINKGTFSFGSGFLDNTAGFSGGGIIGNMWSDYTSMSDCLIEGCVNEGKNEFDNVVPAFSGNTYRAGIVGRINTRSGNITIKDCVNKENVNTPYGSNWAGVVGRIERNAGTDGSCTLNVVIDGCKNEGNFTFTKYIQCVGGMVAISYAAPKLTIKNCENKGSFTVKNGALAVDHEGIGGIIGKLEQDLGDNNGHSYTNPGEKTPERDAIINNCVNNGALTVENGVDGSSGGLTDNNSLNYHVGGIVGRAHWIESLKINRCTNNGKIWVERRQAAKDSNNDYWHGGTRWQGSGGIVGSFITSAGSSYLEISNSRNTGEVLGKYAGGILGATFQIFNDDNVVIRIKYCTNSGRITGIIDGTWDGGRPNNGDTSITPTLYTNIYYGGDAGDAGGIIGGMDQGGGAGGILYVDYCLNEGEIRGGRFAGGILAVRTPMGSGTTGGDPKDSYITGCVNTGTIRNKSGSYYYAAAGIVGSAKGKFTIKKCANKGTLETVTTGQNGYTSTPICSLQEDSWNSVFGTGSDANYFSANGVNDATSGKYYAYACGGRATGTDQGQGILDTASSGSLSTLVSTNTTTAFKGEVISGVESSLKGQTIIITDLRQLSQYDLGARDFKLGANVATANGMYQIANFENATFDGQGYTITLHEYKRLFTTVTNSTVQNVNFAGSVTYGGSSGGAVAKAIGGKSTISNVTTSVTIKKYDTTGHMGVGGIVGEIGIDGMTNIITISNCTNTGSITQTAADGATHREKCTGGIAGHVLVGSPNDVITIENCKNTGAIAGTRVGGIICGVCTNNRQSSNGDKAFQNARVNIINCENTANISGYTMAAGIVADASDRAGPCAEKTNGAERDAFQIPIPTTLVEGCLNRGTITANGKPASYKNNGHVVFAGGLVGLADGNITIKDSINTGKVDSQTTDGKNNSRQTGGILAGKLHQSYDTSDANRGVTITNCKNTGDVLSNANGIGGIAGYVWRGNMTITSCVNTGHVVSMSTASESTAYCAGGILGYVRTWGDADSGKEIEGRTWQEKWSEAEYKITIENCVNAGKIEIKIAPMRDADAWKTAAGIVGGSATGIKITGCVHTGSLEDNAPWFNSTFPIANSLELVWTFPDNRYNWNEVPDDDPNRIKAIVPTKAYTYGDNYYTAGSVDDVLTVSTVWNTPNHNNYHIINHTGQPMYQLSSLATPEQAKIAIQRANVYAFDRVTYLDEQIEFAEWIYFDDEDPNTNQPGHVEDEGNIKWKGLGFTDDQIKNLGAQIDKGNALMNTTDATDLWGRQNAVYAQEQAIREAINDARTNNSDYVVMIPEKIPTNAEVKIGVDIVKFSYYDGVKISMTSANNFTLKMDPNDPDYSADEIKYEMWYEGGLDHLIFSDPLKTFAELESLVAENKDLVYSRNMTRSLIAKVDYETNKDKAYGIYKDSVTFVIEKVKVDSYE